MTSESPASTSSVTAYQAKKALCVALGLYGGYGLLRVAFPGQSWLSLLLIAGFYLLPGWALKNRPQCPEYHEVGPEIRLPPWNWKAVRTAGWVGLVVFPPFILGTLAFYWRVCQHDLTVLAPVLWVEQLTPGDGNLEAFLGRLCQGHGASFWGKLGVPASWLAYGGFGFLNELLVALFVAALPEEMFHRGYLMSALERHWVPKRRLLGVPFGVAALLSTLIFAVGHLVGEARTDRLATFFPGLLFAWLWRRTGSVWAPTLVHAASNLLMQWVLAVVFSG
ncbi:MAG: MrtZ family glutamic-type intramembrane protease [Nannocystaceae bacterium]